MWRVAIIVMVCLRVGAATYYVRTDGNNGNTGTANNAGGAWRNVWYAANQVSSGDVVQIGAGEFNEFVTNTVSGSVGNPITFVGQRDGSGNWLTIIDPSTVLTNGWVAATEYGNGVYKQTGMSFETRELTIDNKRVAFVWTNGLDTDINVAYAAPTITNGYQLLTLPANSVLTSSTSFGSLPINWWDGVQAFWTSTNSVTYLRFKDSRNPNGQNIRACPNAGSTTRSDVMQPAIKMSGVSYITWSNVLVRGAFCAVFIDQIGGHHNVVESNYLSNGYDQVAIETRAHDNVIRNNQITANYYGYNNIGGWGRNTNYTTRMNLYLVGKFLMSNQQSEFQNCVDLLDCGATNIISANHIYGGLGAGVRIWGQVDGGWSQITNTVLSGNVVENHAAAALFLFEGQYATQIFSNRVSDANMCMRYHHMDNGTESNRLVYIYRNEFYQTNDTATHIYAHFNSPGGSLYHPTFWNYQNSYSGGVIFMDTTTAYAVPDGGLTNCFFLNDIMSGCYYAGLDNWTIAAWNTNIFGVFDYNLVTPPYPTYPSSSLPTWFGAHNKTNSVAEWPNAQNMSFALVAGSKAIDNGQDLPSVYPSLPQTGQTKTGTAWDIGAFEFDPNTTNSVARITNFHVKKTKVGP